jgi:hypothetical protein
MSPNIVYDIYLPETDQNTRSMVESAISSEEERSKQFLSLLIQKNFIPKDEGIGKSQQSASGIAAAGNTGIEFFSNQLSNMLSDINKDVDVGLNYYPGDQVTNQELEFALSTQLLNDRVNISYNNNVDIGANKQSTKTNNIVGDFNVEYKFTDNGKVKMKVFNRSNENYFDLYKSATTQGIGLFYKEDFNTFKELMNKYYYTIFFKKKEQKPETDDDSALNNSDDEPVNFSKKDN